MQITGHEEKNAEYYDQIFSKDYNEQTRDFLYSRVFEKIMSLENPSILEIGCGTGYLAKGLIEQEIPYRGFDFSPEAIAKARQYSPSGEFNVADAYLKENYQPVDYNTVVCMEVLEHVDDFRLIENIPAGVHFIATVPDFDDIAHVRLYTDPKRDIVERYAPYMEVKEVLDIPCFNPAQNKNVHIYMFCAIIKPHKDNSEMERAGHLTIKKTAENSGDNNKTRLNLGCANEIINGWINIDNTDGAGIDHTMDFEQCADRPLPFDDNSIDEINCSGTLARINNILPLMQELHRIAKPGCQAKFTVPYGSSDSAYEDPTLIRRFFLKSFNYFSQTYQIGENPGYRGDWKPIEVMLTVDKKKYANKIAEEIAQDIEHCRNVVIQMTAILRAIKPARLSDRKAPDVPDYRIVME